MQTIQQRDKEIEKATRRMIARDLQAAHFYLGAPGSQSRGRPPRKTGLKK